MANIRCSGRRRRVCICKKVNRMKNLKTAISALILLMLAGCNNTRQYFPKQLPPAEIEIVRFDSALLSVRGSEDILRLYADYPGFMGFYSENILGIEATDTAFMLEALPKYLSDTIYHFAEVNRQVMSTFADIRDLRGSLSEGLETRAEKPRFIILAEGDLRACWVSVAQRGVTGACLAHDRQEGTVRTGTKRPQTAVPAWLEWTG